MERKVLRAGTAVIAGALLLRLLCGSFWSQKLSAGLPAEAASLFIFLQTGRLVRPSHIAFATDPTEETTEETTTETTTEATEETVAPTVPQTPVTLPVFTPGDAESLTINSGFSHGADLSALLSKPLDWDLTEEGPTVLILHSHGSESFAPTGQYKEVSPYHTSDTSYNMISVGAYVTELLEAGGISVLHDTSLHDQPSYNDAYDNSRASAQAYLKQYPSIKLVLDLHRDSYEDENGNQLVHTVFSQGTTLAPLMFVVGTDRGGLNHPGWQENLSLALKLQTQIENICPGICRSINLRTQRFNQDLSQGSLLVEVGASGNSREEALRSARILAEAILSLAHGSR